MAGRKINLDHQEKSRQKRWGKTGGKTTFFPMLGGGAKKTVNRILDDTVPKDGKKTVGESRMSSSNVLQFV